MTNTQFYLLVIASAVLCSALRWINERLRYQEWVNSQDQENAK